MGDSDLLNSMVVLGEVEVLEGVGGMDATTKKVCFETETVTATEMEMVRNTEVPTPGFKFLPRMWSRMLESSNLLYEKYAEALHLVAETPYGRVSFEEGVGIAMIGDTGLRYVVVKRRMPNSLGFLETMRDRLHVRAPFRYNVNLERTPCVAFPLRNEVLEWTSVLGSLCAPGRGTKLVEQVQRVLEASERTGAILNSVVFLEGGLISRAGGTMKYFFVYQDVPGAIDVIQEAAREFDFETLGIVAPGGFQSLTLDVDLFQGRTKRAYMFELA
jgi:hypothetical protein